MRNDSIYIHDVTTNPDYDYLSDIDPTSAKIEQTAEKYSSSVGDGLNSKGLRDISTPFAYMFILVVIGVLAYSLLRKFNFFSKNIGLESEASMGNDTIYGHDWRKEMGELMAKQNNSEAAVLCYLYWLDKLNDMGAIAFHKSKTPGMMMREVEEFVANARQHQAEVSVNEAEAQTAPDIDYDALLANTRTLTHHYLHIRYGHKQASQALAQQLIALVGL